MSKKKVKIAIIGSKEIDGWISCRSITNDLQTSYELLPSKEYSITFFDYNFNQSELEVVELAKKIASYDPDFISFINYQPLPTKLISILKYVFLQTEVKYIFHVYGNFALHFNEWIEIEPDLTEALFICPSQNHLKLINTFLKNKKVSKKLAFPMNEKTFYFSPSHRKKFRTKNKIQETDRVICYSGRISPEKNILLLVRTMIEQMHSDPNLYFYFAGSPDELGANRFGQKNIAGKTLTQIEELITNTPSHIQKRLKYLGVLTPKELLSLYNGADLFVSLSTYHDESFGISPLEALYCGLPLILSNWGGYSDFYDKKSCAVNLIDISMQDATLWLDISVFKSRLNNFKQANSSKRRELELTYKDKYSLTNTSNQLKKLLKEYNHKFTGFTQNSKNYSELLIQYKNGDQLFHKKPESLKLYKEIYQNYIGTKNVKG
jgi:glycosyltransferase involved in cell wall biosynthesis